jgi:4-hydroxy-tetrahydrodipicolinate reductase
MTIKVCIAGATGWVGTELCKAVERANDMQLVGAVSRAGAGQKLQDAIDEIDSEIIVSGTVAEALAQPTDVMVDYTSAGIVKKNVMTAIEKGVNVVIGSSGLTDDDFVEIDKAARDRQVGVIAGGNFAITAVLLQRFACDAARYLTQWEIIDYCSATKPDAPSGTARELSYRLAQVKMPEPSYPVGETIGEKAARGATLNGTQMHSVRLPGFVSSVEAIFGANGERLSIRHDSMDGAEPYIQGTLLAIRKVKEQIGLVRGLDKVMD